MGAEEGQYTFGTRSGSRPKRRRGADQPKANIRPPPASEVGHASSGGVTTISGTSGDSAAVVLEVGGRAGTAQSISVGSEWQRMAFSSAGTFPPAVAAWSELSLASELLNPRIGV